MFNQLTPADVVTAIGTTLRASARSEQPSEFERDQLMSVYSATRHLSVELAAYEPEIKRFQAGVVDLLNDFAGRDGEVALDLPTAARRVADADGVAPLGDAISGILAALRDDRSESARALVTELRVRLRGLADREVDLLADGLR